MDPARFKLTRRVAVAALYAQILSALGVCAYGIWVMIDGGSLTWGAAFVAGGLAAMIAGIFLYCQVSLLYKFTSNSYRLYDTMLDVLEQLRRQSDYMHSVSENSTLSDRAKEIVYREKDFEFLRDMIAGAIVRQDWETTEHLIRELDGEFGYHEEAARFREEVGRARRATTEEKIAAALERFESLCGAQKWDQARVEMLRLRTLFPGEERIARLDAEIENRRLQFKRSLLREYDQAVRIQNVDLAHELLFKLDTYLAPNEAAAMKESARGVFKAKLMQMGAQFSLAVSDRKFAQAVEVGEQLVSEFPNSRFAQEIAQMLPVLRTRAQQDAREHASASAL